MRPQHRQEVHYPAAKQAPGWKRFRFNRAVEFFHLMCAVVMGLSLFPAVALLYYAWHAASVYPVWVKLLVFSVLVGPAYFVFGLSMIVTCVVTKTVLGLRIRPGLFSYYDWETIQWMGYNSLILLVNGCFLDNLRLSPFQTWFYRAMGARIGKDAKINTKGFADLSMIDIGEGATIGDGVTLICHAAERGFLRLAPVKVGRNASIGLDTIIMPDTEIGEGAIVAPRSFLRKGTRISSRARWQSGPGAGEGQDRDRHTSQPNRNDQRPRRFQRGGNRPQRPGGQSFRQGQGQGSSGNFQSRPPQERHEPRPETPRPEMRPDPAPQIRPESRPAEASGQSENPTQPAV